MPNEQLLAHIRSELARGADKNSITQPLLAVGWKMEDINAAMEVAAPTPAPSMPPVPAPSRPAPQNAAAADAMVVEISEAKTMAQNWASGVFILCVAILTFVSILGVWSIFSKDVIGKSFETLGLLAFVSIVIIVASRFVGNSHGVAAPNPNFRPVRNATLGTLIVSAVLLAFFGVLAIWDVITDKDVLTKSLSSLAIIAFSSFVIVLVALEREQNPVWKKKVSGGGSFAGLLIAAFFFFWIFGWAFR